MRKKRQKLTLGRHDIEDAHDPPSGFADLPRSEQNNGTRVVLVAVTDPWGDGKRRQRAYARVDLLDWEKRKGLIDEASYQEGRALEAMLEHWSRIGGGGQWMEGNRIDGATASDIAVESNIKRAKKVAKHLAWVAKIVGQVDCTLLRNVLGNKMTYSDCVVISGHGYGQKYVARRFRDALKNLADAKGKRVIE